jgi:hypothetical protein
MQHVAVASGTGNDQQEANMGIIRGCGLCENAVDGFSRARKFCIVAWTVRGRHGSTRKFVSRNKVETYGGGGVHVIRQGSGWVGRGIESYFRSGMTKIRYFTSA